MVNARKSFLQHSIQRSNGNHLVECSNPESGAHFLAGCGALDLMAFAVAQPSTVISRTLAVSTKSISPISADG
jgi:hypothetical protein